MFDKQILGILQPQKDTILLFKDGTVGIAYKIKQDADFITSGALLHLTIKNNYANAVLSKYLTLVLNSPAVQMQSQRDAGGSIIKHWKPSEIKAILILIINPDTQAKIEAKIKQSFALQETSKQLLNLAKKRLKWLLNKTKVKQ